MVRCKNYLQWDMSDGDNYPSQKGQIENEELNRSLCLTRLQLSREDKLNEPTHTIDASVLSQPFSGHLSKAPANPCKFLFQDSLLNDVEHV